MDSKEIANNGREKFSSSEYLSGLYLHFPFCESKCHYCDFFSFAEEKFEGAYRQKIYSAIQAELRLFPEQLRIGFQTVFLGGGTPSLVPLEVLHSVLQSVPLRTGAEVTMEVNPSSVSAEKIPLWISSGVNRISMGVQALNNDRLKWLGRVHSAEEVAEALEILAAKGDGFQNVSTDYILGVPDQTPALIRKELTEILRDRPYIKHISAYLLTLKENNPKFSQLPDDETQLSHLMAAQEVLAELGFEHYEISNFAKPGFRARHNENYWLGGGYLGIGPSAHGFWPELKMRTKNWSNLEKYVTDVIAARPAWEWTETLTAEQERIEFLMLRLRRAEGLRLSEYREKFSGWDLLHDRTQELESLLAQGLIKQTTDQLALTTRGLFLSDSVLGELV